MRFLLTLLLSLIFYAALLALHKQLRGHSWQQALRPSPPVFFTLLIIAIVATNLLVNLVILGN